MPDRRVNIVINYEVHDSQIRKSEQLVRRAEQATEELNRETREYSNNARKAGQEGTKAFKQIGDTLKTVSVAIIAYQLLDLTKKVIAVRGEFQKFEAVLTNTLGSRSQALIALARINEFAKTTPYGVSELTNSFIKLANRGVEPTLQEMRAIADLSATLGKPFEQVVEAILDINNPERWKEIGVKAETAGNKVRLSFRDTTIEVDRTVRGVTDAVTALGKLNGVAGSTEAISRTLAGQTSNLTDEWEQLLNTIGRGNEGVLFEAVQLLQQGIRLSNEALKGSQQRFEELQSTVLSSQLETFQKFAKGFNSLDEALAAYNSEIDKNIARIDQESQAQKELANQQLNYLDRIMGTSVEIEKEKKAASEKLKWLNNERDIYKNDVIPALQEYIDKIKNKQSTEEQAKQASLAKVEAERMKKMAEDVNEYLAYLSELEMFNTAKILASRKEQRAQDVEDEKKRAQELEEITKQAAENTRKHWEESYGKRREAAEKAKQEQEAIEEQIKDSIVSIVRAIADYSFSSRSSEMDQIRQYYDEQEALAGDNERLRQEIALKRERALNEERQRQKEAEKKSALAKIAIDTATNIVEAFPNAVLMAAAAALGLIQAANVQKLKDGVIDLKGPGTSRSDSIPAMLSRGESVMTAEETKSSNSILRAIRAKKLNDKILRDVTTGRSGRDSVFTDPKIAAELEAIKKELQMNRPQDVVERHHVLYKSTRKSESYKQYIRAKTLGL